MSANDDILAECDKIQTSVDTIRNLLKTPPVLQHGAEGIDVSLYQANINWVQVKASGKAFAFIKATQGVDITDPYWAANWAGAKAAGLPRGAYHYYKNNADPVAQANFFCMKLLADKGELQPVVDIEDTSSLPNGAQIKQFLDAVENTLKVKPIIYTGKWFWDSPRYGNLGAQVTWESQYDLWVADYTTNAEPALPGGWVSYKFRQYSSSGRVSGISANVVDLDRYNG